MKAKLYRNGCNKFKINSIIVAPAYFTYSKLYLKINTGEISILTAERIYV